MKKILTDIEKANHPYYKIMNLKKDDLLKELNSWTRLELIDWLAWNDPYGIYRDQISLTKLGNVLSKERAIAEISKQILEPSKLN